jgi:hypothetical protein
MHDQHAKLGEEYREKYNNNPISSHDTVDNYKEAMHHMGEAKYHKSQAEGK